MFLGSDDLGKCGKDWSDGLWEGSLTGFTQVLSYDQSGVIHVVVEVPSAKAVYTHYSVVFIKCYFSLMVPASLLMLLLSFESPPAFLGLWSPTSVLQSNKGWVTFYPLDPPLDFCLCFFTCPGLNAAPSCPALGSDDWIEHRLSKIISHCKGSKSDSPLKNPLSYIT